MLYCRPYSSLINRYCMLYCYSHSSLIDVNSMPIAAYYGVCNTCSACGACNTCNTMCADIHTYTPPYIRPYSGILSIHCITYMHPYIHTYSRPYRRLIDAYQNCKLSKVYIAQMGNFLCLFQAHRKPLRSFLKDFPIELVVLHPQAPDLDTKFSWKILHQAI